MKQTVDILVAVRDEQENIPVFIEEILSLNVNNVDIRILFLEDGSTDNTVELLKKFSKKNKNIDYISLNNMYGQYAALTFGMKISNADAIITMDVDGGHPTRVVKEMINHFCEKNNVVQGVRSSYKRKKSYRTIGSFLYIILFFLVTGVNFFRQNVMFRLLDKKAKEIFLKNKNWWHILRTNFKDKDNLKISYLYYNAPERQKGTSKYNLLRLLFLSYKSFFAMITPVRYLVINILLVLFIIFSFLSLDYIVFLVGLIFFIIEITSFIIVRSYYPIDKIKIIESSIKNI